MHPASPSCACFGVPFGTQNRPRVGGHIEKVRFPSSTGPRSLLRGPLSLLWGSFWAPKPTPCGWLGWKNSIPWRGIGRSRSKQFHYAGCDYCPAVESDVTVFSLHKIFLFLFCSACALPAAVRMLSVFAAVRLTAPSYHLLNLCDARSCPLGRLVSWSVVRLLDG